MVYKKLLGEPVGFEDVQDIDEDAYKSLKHILNYKENGNNKK